MTRLYILFGLLLLLLSSGLKAQSWSTTVSGAPVLSFRQFNHEYTSNRSDLGQSFGIRQEYNFNQFLSLGTELEYVRSSFSFYSPFDATGKDAGSRTAFRHEVDENRLYVPLLARVNFPHTERFSIYALAGLGGNAVIRANRHVTQAGESEMANREETYDHIAYKGGNLVSRRSPVVNNFTFGIGAEWKMGGQSLVFEMKSRDDFQRRVYQNVQSGDQKDVFAIKTSMLSFGLGLKF